MNSLIKRIELVQGDNSDQHSFSIPSYPDLTSTDWVGIYTIRDKNIKGSVVSSGFLGKSDDFSEFVFYLSPDITASLPIGSLFLSIELKNQTLANPFRQEIVQCVFKVNPSGVTN